MRLEPPKRLWVYWDSRAGEWRSTSVEPGPWAVSVIGPYEVRPARRTKRGTTPRT